MSHAPLAIVVHEDSVEVIHFMLNVSGEDIMELYGMAESLGIGVAELHDVSPVYQIMNTGWKGKTALYSLLGPGLLNDNRVDQYRVELFCLEDYHPSHNSYLGSSDRNGRDAVLPAGCYDLAHLRN